MSRAFDKSNVGALLLMAAAQPGQELHLQVYREGQYIEIALPLQRMAMQF